MSKKHCCEEYARALERRRGPGFSRRVFVRTGGLAMVSWGLAPGFVGRALGATAPGSGGRKVLICVFQRGAVDGLNMIVPHGDKAYYDARGSIAIPPPGRGDGRALDLDGFFGLHPALAPLQPWYRDGNLAIVHAVGSPDATRSHFDAQDYMESGTPGSKSTADGWLNRLLAQTAEAGLTAPRTLTRGIAASAQPPRALAGSQPSLTVGDLQQFLGEGGGGGRGGPQTDRATSDAAGNDMAGNDMSGGDASADAQVRRPQAGGRRGASSEEKRRALASGFEALYGSDDGDVVLATGSEALDAVAFLKAADPLRYQPANGARYPRAGLGRQLQQVAQLIKADVGLEIAFTDIGGWDTHRQQGGVDGPLAARLTELGAALAAFAQDLGDRMQDVVVLTMSEFGRTVEENGSAGTDHGHANASLVLGGAVNGGKVYGEWPGLHPEQRYEGRDLAVTTDFRDLFGEVADVHLAPRDPDALFPGRHLERRRYKGLIRG